MRNYDLLVEDIKDLDLIVRAKIMQGFNNLNANTIEDLNYKDFRLAIDKQMIEDTKELIKQIEKEDSSFKEWNSK